jgi:hypothetical protein
MDLSSDDESEDSGSEYGPDEDDDINMDMSDDKAGKSSKSAAKVPRNSSSVFDVATPMSCQRQTIRHLEIIDFHFFYQSEKPYDRSKRRFARPLTVKPRCRTSIEVNTYTAQDPLVATDLAARAAYLLDLPAGSSGRQS